MEWIAKAKRLIKKHEGLRLLPYICPSGKLTIGYGRNLEDVGITTMEAELLLQHDIVRIEKEAKEVFKKVWNELDDIRKAVIVDMLYNLGFSRFIKFKKFIAAVKKKDFDTAAKEMLDSLWAKQVKSRATELAELMKKGEF